MEFTVNNPFDYDTIVYSAITALPPGWTYQLDWDMEFIEPMEGLTNNVIVTPPIGLNPFTTIGTTIDFQIVSWIEVRNGEFGDVVTCSRFLTEFALRKRALRIMKPSAQNLEGLSSQNQECLSLESRNIFKYERFFNIFHILH